MNLILNTQQQHWEATFLQKPDMFGADTSAPAQVAADLFKRAGATRLLELGGGQGRDTLFFASSGLKVHTLDYSESAIEAIAEKVAAMSMHESVKPLQHDIRNPLPFKEATFDACYSHMLYCMALTKNQLEFLSSEVRRVLCPGGLHVYTARTKEDPHFNTGIHRGEDMYEISGFIVHFFGRDLVDHLADGYEILSVDTFEEGKLPRKLYRVALRTKSS